MRDAHRLICLPIAIATLVLLVGAPSAEAKSERTASYKLERVWPTAVRFLRVDEGFTIVEKDREVAYIIFQFEDRGKQYNGALELIRTKDGAQREAVRMICKMQDRPSYMELGVLDRLLRKLRDELGEPPPAPPADPPPDKDKKGDDDKDESKDGSSK